MKGVYWASCGSYQLILCMLYMVVSNQAPCQFPVLPDLLSGKLGTASIFLNESISPVKINAIDDHPQLKRVPKDCR